MVRGVPALDGAVEKEIPFCKTFGLMGRVILQATVEVQELPATAMVQEVAEIPPVGAEHIVPSQVVPETQAAVEVACDSKTLLL